MVEVWPDHRSLHMGVERKTKRTVWSASAEEERSATLELEASRASVQPSRAVIGAGQSHRKKERGCEDWISGSSGGCVTAGAGMG